MRLIGQALDPQLGVEAELEAQENPRFEWLGERRHAQTQALLAGSRVVVVSSLNEGGPAIITEAIAAGVPVLSTRMPATLSLLGEDYPGCFERRDEAGLAELLERCEADPQFLELLRERVLARRADIRPEVEREALRELLESAINAHSKRR